MDKPWIHTRDDGRGARQVYVDGKPMNRVLYADTKRGIVRYHPYQVHAGNHDYIVEKTRRGKVELRPLDG